MALTDIITPQGNRATLYFNRGNIGILVDIVAMAHNMLYFPAITGGGGEHSYTF